MQLKRNEILTGLLVLVTVALLTGILILLGAPGLFRPLVTYKIYMDNAAGIKLGAPVLLAGRKIGQVQELYSPVSKEDAARAEAAAALALQSGRRRARRPPRNQNMKRGSMSGWIRTLSFTKTRKARLVTLGLLGETAIDITQGNDSSGRASDGEIFAGERVPDFGESISKMLDIVKPVATEATATLKELQTTAAKSQPDHGRKFAAQHGVSAQFRTFVENLTSMTARDSSLSLALKNVEKISTDISSNDNIKITLQNFRDSSDKLKGILADLNQLGPDLKESSANVKEATATLKTQPWRLIWPSTKKYPEDEQAAPTPARKPVKTQRRPSPTPAARTR